MLNVPQFMLNNLRNMSPEILFQRAKLVENLQFNEFNEWIEMEIQK